MKTSKKTVVLTEGEQSLLCGGTKVKVDEPSVSKKGGTLDCISPSHQPHD